MNGFFRHGLAIGQFSTMEFKKIIYWLLFIIPFYWACDRDELPLPEIGDEEVIIGWQAAANASSRALIIQFWNKSGNYFNTDNSGNVFFQYWPNAHALDVMIDAYERTGDTAYRYYMDQWFQGVRKYNGNSWNNEFYDDMEWIALAQLRAYKATGNSKYKDAALEIWEYIKEGWNENAGGGIAWRRSQSWSKNACSNGPAAILAARLYKEFSDEENRQWAVKIYEWLKSTLVNPVNGAVWDNVDSRTGFIKKDWIFTYNQGTFIGAAVELHQLFHEQSYLDDAILAANYAISNLVENSILKNEGGDDGGLFKGIFVRYFTLLVQQKRLDVSMQRRFLQFIELNAETLWTQGTTLPTVLFSPNWRQKPGNTTGLTEQLSGCMLIESVAHLDKNGFLKN